MILTCCFVFLPPSLPFFLSFFLFQRTILAWCSPPLKTMRSPRTSTRSTLLYVHLLFHDLLVIVKKRLTVCENQVLFRKHQLAPCCSTVTLECALEQKSLNYWITTRLNSRHWRHSARGLFEIDEKRGKWKWCAAVPDFCARKISSAKVGISRKVFYLLVTFFNPFTPKIKMQILRTIHIGNVWVMLWELIATSAIV